METPTRRRDRDEAVSAGALILVATPIGNLGDISARAVEVLSSADVIAAEHPEHTRKLLSACGIPAAGRLRPVHQHNERHAARWVLDEVAAGKTVVYVSDAGTPGISDPGAALVQVVADAGLTVGAVPGPSALLHALVVSGFAGGRFSFEGFLPRKGQDRRARLAVIATSDAPVIIYESPNRVAATIVDLAEHCGAQRRAALCRELTKRFEEVRRATLAELAKMECSERGEYVIVIDAAAVQEVAIGDETIAAALREARAAGATARDAAAEVASVLGISKRRAYELAIRLSGTD